MIEQTAVLLVFLILTALIWDAVSMMASVSGLYSATTPDVSISPYLVLTMLRAQPIHFIIVSVQTISLGFVASSMSD